jgi:hypothetical protein
LPRPQSFRGLRCESPKKAAIAERFSLSSDRHGPRILAIRISKERWVLG